MAAILTEEDYSRIYRGTGLSERELERLLRSAGASKANEPMPVPIIKRKTFFRKIIERIIF